MACTLSNKYAKNLSKRTVLLQLIIKNVVTCFLEHSICLCCNVILYFDPKSKLQITAKCNSYQITNYRYNEKVISLQITYYKCH